MKPAIFIAFLFLTVAAAAQKIVNDPHVQLRTVNGPFHTVMVSSGIDLFLSAGDEVVAVSAGNAEDRDEIQTKVENGILKISSDAGKAKRWFNSDRKLRAYVSYKTLQAIIASGGSTVKVESVMKGDKLTLAVSGGSKLEGSVDVGELLVSQSGAADITLRGKATTAKITASGASDFMGIDLASENCNLVASGASDITITAHKELSATASGASDITYRGSPEIKQANTSGASSIQKKS